MDWNREWFRFVLERITCDRQFNGLSIHPYLKGEMIWTHLDKPWDWCEISQHPNITLEHILDHPACPWNWYCVSKNPNITMEMICEHLDKPWDWEGMSRNKHLTWEMICAHPDKPWNWRYISQHPNISMEHIRNHPACPWDWRYISVNPNLTSEIILSNLDKKWNWYFISKHPGIEWEFISNHPELPWDWSKVSEHPNITWEILCAHPDKPWDLSRNPNITREIICAHPDKPWNWYWIFDNPKLTWEDIEILCSKFKLSEDVSEHSYWYQISRNPNITIHHFLTHKRPWYWAAMPYLKDVAFEDIIHLEKWDIQVLLVKNRFTKEKERFERRVQHQAYVQTHLLEEFVKKAYHPSRIEAGLNAGMTLEEVFLMLD